MTHDDQVIEDTEDLEQNGDDDSCAANEMVNNMTIRITMYTLIKLNEFIFLTYIGLQDLIQDYNDLQTEANSMNDLTKSLTNVRRSYMSTQS